MKAKPFRSTKYHREPICTISEVSSAQLLLRFLNTILHPVLKKNMSTQHNFLKEKLKKNEKDMRIRQHYHHPRDTMADDRKNPKCNEELQVGLYLS